MSNIEIPLTEDPGKESVDVHPVLERSIRRKLGLPLDYVFSEKGLKVIRKSSRSAASSAVAESTSKSA